MKSRRPRPRKFSLITSLGLDIDKLDISLEQGHGQRPAQASLQYEVRQSAINNISGVASAETNGTIVRLYTADLTVVGVTGLTPGTVYFFNVIVKDAAGNKAAYSVATAATVALPDNAPPQVSLVSPVDGDTVADTAVTVAANATDDVAVRAVWFMLDGAVLGSEILQPPYSLLWDTTQVPNGLHTLTAVAQDTVGNQTTSPGIAVTVDNGTTSYAIPPGGAQSFKVRGASNAKASISHSYIDGGSNPPTGIAIVSYETVAKNPSGPAGSAATPSVVVSEAGVPATVATPFGMAYVDIADSLSTGVAIANETLSDAVISYYFTDAGGATVKQGSLTLASHRQIAGFLDSPPFSIPAPFRGTFSFSSSVPVAAIATRNLINERGEYVWSTMPISAALPVGNPLLPMFANGGGWNTQVILTNSSAVTLTGVVEFYGQGTSTAAATPLTLTVNGTPGSSFAYSVPPHSMYRMVTQGVDSATIVSGSVRLTPDASFKVAPNAFAILSYRSDNVTVSETSVFAIPTDTVFRVFVESSTSAQGQILSGIAVANGSANPNTALLELTTLDGTAIGGPLSVSVPGNGEFSKFANELFTNLPSGFRGLLRITSMAPIGVVDLRARYNSRGDLLVTTIPPVNENAQETGAVVFPHLVSGGGYTTEIILFGQPGIAASGTLSFTSTTGTAMPGADAITP